MERAFDLSYFAGVFGVGNPRGFCAKMSIKSRMFDAWIVVDGGEFPLQNFWSNHVFVKV